MASGKPACDVSTESAPERFPPLRKAIAAQRLEWFNACDSASSESNRCADRSDRSSGSASKTSAT
jgi:hypothetical protein